VEALVNVTVSTYGRLDCAHNNAGIAGKTFTVADDTEENWDRILSINLKGVWLCMKYQVPVMLKQGGGSIVNTASDAGLIGVKRTGAYVASKHGVVGLTKTAALEYAKAGIRVNAVCPGPIDTPMLQKGAMRNPKILEKMVAAQPNGRLGKPEEIAEAALWLCSDAASFVTGLAMPVDGGYLAQ
jgi:NAD(P)-dependent dehydrogenase (short-subunit alcohol dehydrogenase family)